MRVGADGGRDALAVRQARVLEQPELELECKQACDGVINQRLVKHAVVHGVDRTFVESGRRHDQVVACLDGIGGSGLIIGLDVLFPHGAPDVVPVGHQRAAVVPFAAQLVAEQPLVESDGRAVDRLVPEHERGAPLFRHALEGRQEPAFQRALRQVGLGGVAPALRIRITGEVLRACEDGVFVESVSRLRVLLVSLHHRGRELADEHRVLAEGLVDATPARVTPDAQHRREGPMHPGARDFLGRDARGFLHFPRVPAARHAELRGEDRRAWPE